MVEGDINAENHDLAIWWLGDLVIWNSGFW
jgi:hypothetical protein